MDENRKGRKQKRWGEWEDNEYFIQYYKAQKIMGDEEFDEFYASLKTELPVVFRINGRGQFADQIRNKFQAEFIKNKKQVTNS